MKYTKLTYVFLIIFLFNSLALSQEPVQQPKTTQEQKTESSKEQVNETTAIPQVKQEFKIALEPTISEISEAEKTSSITKISWQPPEPRAKNKGPFGPLPWDGINIFKGEAGQWLAEVIESMQIEEDFKLKNSLIQNYVDQLGTFVGSYSIVPNKNLKFIITKSEAPNATSIGGGTIIISQGLLQIVETEDELAGVLAHEIAHDTYAHVQRTMTRQLFWLAKIRKVNSKEEVEEAIDKLLVAYEKSKFATTVEKLSGIPRFDELKADQQAFYTTYRAGYNPRAIAAVLKRISENHRTTGVIKKVKNFVLGTHPLTSYRSFALDWEAGFIKLPPKNSSYTSPAFTAMKEELNKVTNIDTESDNEINLEMDKELSKKDK
jgi:predicted Zn-dependent protease